MHVLIAKEISSWNGEGWWGGFINIDKQHYLGYDHKKY